MKKTFNAANSGKGRLFAGAGLAALTLAAFATPAYAQDETAELAEVTETTPVTTAIVVTGSRIARPNLDSQVPVTILEGEAFFQ